MPFNQVVKGYVPGIQLESGLSTESFAGTLQFGSWERRYCLAHDLPRQSMPKMALTFALSNTEPAIQQPRRVDQIWLLAEALRIDLTRRLCCAVGVGFEAHNRAEERRVYVGRSMLLAQKHVVGQGV